MHYFSVFVVICGEFDIIPLARDRATYLGLIIRERGSGKYPLFMRNKWIFLNLSANCCYKGVKPGHFKNLLGMELKRDSSLYF